jgi:ribonuclease D
MISRYLPVPVRRILNIKVSPIPPEYLLIDQQNQLALLLKALDQVDEVSLDTEADNMFHYKTRVCLLQFLVGNEVFMVDVLAPLKLDGLWSRLKKKHLLMHGSDFDIRLLHDFCEFRPKSMFDTMLAAQLVNRPRVGLASLLEDHFAVKLSKESQKANWSKRPLTKKMLDYAALDVWHLPALRDILMRDLKKLKRTEWLRQQCEAQIESGLTGFAPRDENAWRIGKSDRLRGAGLSVLFEIWHWREKTAERIDVPPFKTCNNERLLKIANAAEEGESLKTILATVHLGRRHDRLLPSLRKAVAAGLARDPASLPRRKRKRDPNNAPLTEREVKLQDRIKADRDRVSKKLKLEPTLIANRNQLARIARNPDQIDEVLLAWQADLIRNEPALKQA